MKRIALLTGGQSSEREIALRSAKNVQEVLKSVFDVTLFDVPVDLPTFLDQRGDFAAVVPVLHGVGGEDGAVQGFLETLNIPYIFSGVQAHAVAMDKEKAKILVAANGVRTPGSKMIRSGQSAQFDHTVVVKPFDGGSSVATAVARSQAELDRAILKGLEFSSAVLVEDFIQGDEYTVAVVEIAGETEVLPVIAIRPKEGFFDFESKYNVATLADEICPAPISDELAALLQSMALTAHRTLGCRHVSRTDIMVDATGVPWFLETNTIPGMTGTSLLPKALKAGGYDFAETLQGWIESVS
jgi:D-alanine-D-alanine ligase